MILTGRHVSAQEGKSLGFVNDVAPVGQSVDVAKKWAAQILDLSPMSIRASKEAVYKGLEEPTVAARHRQPVEVSRCGGDVPQR